MEIRLPRLGEGAESGTVVSIAVAEGDLIQKDQTILELENEKAVAPIPSPASGRIVKLHVKPGDEVSVGQLLITLADETAAPAAEKKPPAPPREEAPRRAEEAPRAEPYRYESPSGLAPPAAPSVRKLAAELGIDLTRVRGSERGGRITRQDLKTYIQQLQELVFERKMTPPRPAAEPVPKIDFSKWGPITRKRLSPLRRTVTEKTTEAWTTIPHVTQFADADISALTELRKKYAPLYQARGVRLTVTSFILKAAVAALKKFPIFNASLDEATQEIIYKEYYHIGVAVDTEAGLIVPVLRDADVKSIYQLSLELAHITEKARQRKIALEELQGGTFTLSNLGGIGGTHFTPIIYKPQVAVLGVGQGGLKPVVRDHKIEPRMILTLGLSYDHRVIDGADGARFIVALVEALENPNEEELKF
ncbi:MAG TPA: 2-oxo acid dehydrogenase subunit E2 [Candidatus Acidoferrales bacterium]|nr:2-oxo acid dehydrogenase subunit E2 [Candidatus Acidoferrales bacterium]